MVEPVALGSSQDSQSATEPKPKRQSSILGFGWKSKFDANAKLREEKLYMQQVSEKLQAFKISQAGSAEATIPDDTVVEPPTW